ncbi:MAG: HEAT repeat domain-containing protein [Candidatus Helarchaeota archaeon]
MRKIEKKILKFVEKKKIEKALDYITQILQDKSNEEKAEAISTLGPLFTKIKELNYKFPDELYGLLIKFLDSEDWIVKRNILRLMGIIADQYIDKIIEKESVSKIKLKATKDPHWAVRVDGINTLGKIGVNINENNQIIIFLSNQSNDDEPEVRLAALASLTSILKKFPEKIKPNLQVFVNRFKNDVDYRVSLAAENSIKEFAESMEE